MIVDPAGRPVPVIVRAVPERAEVVDYLRERIPELLVAWDNGSRDPWRTLDSALALAGESAALHLEDDVLLTRHWHDRVTAAIAERPRSVIQFFSMRRADLTVGSRLDRDFVMMQCVYLPAGLSAELRAYAPTWPGRAKDPTAIDFALRDLLRSKRQPYWIHVPSLVQHRTIPSAINPRRPKNRQSPTFSDPWL